MDEKFNMNQRRLRSSRHMRELTATVRLSHTMFIQPIFVEEGISSPREVEGLTGVQVHTIDSIMDSVSDYIDHGISKFLFFPVPLERAECNFDFSFACKVISRLKETFGNAIWLASDVCLCSYTTHGHCGLLTHDGSRLLNSETVQIITTYALQLAESGVDCIAPSDMMDGRISSIRNALNAVGFDFVSIMSYSAKFSSQFYGPFRDACHSAPSAQSLKDRKTYQLSISNINDAVATALRDAEEGADIIMVKPAAHYGDVIFSLHSIIHKPIAAYHVSGEYAALELLVEKGLAQREQVHIEVWTAMARAGASIIISYASMHAKEWISASQ